MSANTVPINTQTKLIKVKVDANLETKTVQVCDTQGAAGRLLRSTFVMDEGSNTYVVMIFQRTR